MKRFLFLPIVLLGGCINHSLSDSDRARVDAIIVEFKRLNANIERFNDNFGIVTKSVRQTKE